MQYETVPYGTVTKFKQTYGSARERYERFLSLEGVLEYTLSRLKYREVFEDYKKMVKLFHLCFFNRTAANIHMFSTGDTFALGVGRYLQNIKKKYLCGMFCPRLSTMINNIGRNTVSRLFKIGSTDLNAFLKANKDKY